MLKVSMLSMGALTSHRESYSFPGEFFGWLMYLAKMSMVKTLEDRHAMKEQR